MPLTFFKANPRNTGASCGVSFASKDQCVLFKLKRQVSYDPIKRVGSFWDGPQINIKFSLSEIGSIINVFEQNADFSAYHTSGGFKTQITLKPYYKAESDGVEVQKGYTLSAYKNGEDENDKISVMIGFTFGEATALREYLKFCLVHIFSAIYSSDKERAKIAAKEREQEPEKLPTPPQKPKQPEVVDDDDVF
jgi:hypothetical protein